MVMRQPDLAVIIWRNILFGTTIRKMKQDNIFMANENNLSETLSLVQMVHRFMLTTEAMRIL